MSQAIAFIALGSNAGNRAFNIKKAVDGISRFSGTRIIKASPLYETSPVGPKQRDFLNAVIKLETPDGPQALLKRLKKLETLLGRNKNPFRWGPRTIDLDILFYGGKAFATKVLTVPHREIENRMFVLRPFCDIAPEFVHPVIKKTIKELLYEAKKRRPEQRIRKTRFNLCPANAGFHRNRLRKS
ncbi:MAG: 2-amino-4-hydroxy-6-hydroxymethyldihydropteridine diphosphokinase [Endomicrobiales bacterium]|nr:2-amino-4-hydroxy-6-hydroxymethyldihydropteridine diphosphokinase [Endomicrobiales bacterium]